MLCFVVLAFTHFGDNIIAGFRTDAPSQGWALGGLTYAGYNIIGAVVILPIVRHMTSDRDAVIAGIIAGPLAMLPALLFFVCMVAFYPAIANETLPSDFLLKRFDLPAFHILFQFMILPRCSRVAAVPYTQSTSASHVPGNPVAACRSRTTLAWASPWCCSCAACSSPTASASSR